MKDQSQRHSRCRPLSMMLVLVSVGMCGGMSPEGVAQKPSPTGDHTVVRKRAFLAGHTGDYVRCVAFSPDGMALASGGDDNTIRLWDVATGKETATLRGHTDEVWYVAFFPDGKTVVSGSMDGSVRLWDVVAGTQKGSLTGFVPDDEMTWGEMALAPDGKVLAVVTNNKSVKLLDLENRKELRRLAGKWRNLAVSRDGTTLALIGPKGLELRDLASGEVKVTLQGDFGCVAFSPDNRTLAVECDEGTEGLQKLHVRLLDVGTGRLKASFKVESVEEGIMSLAFSPDGKTLAVGRYLDGLQLWDATTGKLKADVPTAADPADNTQYALTLTFSPDGKLLAAGGGTAADLPQEKPIVRVWEVSD